jgi:dTDP-4-amino-4,6-dideoxygalactose transaminase
MNIPQCNPNASYLALKNRIDKATSDTLASGWYILGEQASLFEKSFAEFCDTSFCVGCANGTDAIELSLMAAGIGKGDLVATVANTAVATISAIERAGAIPVFVDIDSETLTMSSTSLQQVLKKFQIKAVVVVHLFGHPADIETIVALTKGNGIPVIEDCAQAHGASINGKRVGTFGITGTFSFYPTKNLGAFGDGGAVVTNEPILKDALISLRQYGWKERYISSVKGINSRLDELQAAILNVKLEYLNETNGKRRSIAELYNDALSGIGDIFLPKEISGCHHVYHQYVIKTDQREELCKFLRNSQIGSAIHYPVPVHKQPAYSECKYIDLSVTESVNGKILSLPMFPELSVDSVEYIIEKINQFFS